MGLLLQNTDWELRTSEKVIFSQFWRLEVLVKVLVNLVSFEASVLGVLMAIFYIESLHGLPYMCLCPNLYLLLGHKSCWCRAQFCELILS